MDERTELLAMLDAMRKRMMYVDNQIAFDKLQRDDFRRQIQEVAVIFHRASNQFKTLSRELATIKEYEPPDIKEYFKEKEKRAE